MATTFLNGRMLKFICLALVLVTRLQDVIGSGQIEVRFIRYSDSCREDLNTNKCDPKFTFCLGRPQANDPSMSSSNCQYILKGETDHWQDTNDINFGSDMKGVGNPIIASTSRIMDPEVMLAVKVRDDDIFQDDYLIMLKATLRNVYPSKEESSWTDCWTSQSGYSIYYQYRMYCDAYYYTSSCDVYCKAQDSSSGHYICDQQGRKKCLPGWQGSNCNEDVNECQQGYCVRGECQNLPGSVRCICPVNYTGADCSQLISACITSPCLNGGTCFGHNSQSTYICQCVSGWEGLNCGTRVNPCSANPCANGGDCVIQSDAATYTCSCKEPYYGPNCLQLSTMTTPATTSTTTVTTTTTSTTSVESTTSEPVTTTLQTTTTELVTTESPTLTTSESPTTSFPVTTGEMTTTLLISTTSESAAVQTESDRFEITSTIHYTEGWLPGAERVDQQEDDFRPWYAAFIVAAFLVLVIILLVFVIRRRRNKKAHREDLTIVSPTGSNLVFENNMYNNANRNNLAIEKQTRDLPVCPENGVCQAEPTDDTAANPTYAQVDETRVRNSDYCRIQERPNSQNCEVKSTCAFQTQAAQQEKAAQNNYSDFNTLRKEASRRNKEAEPGEPEYQDLDSVSNGGYTEALPTFRANSNDSVTINFSAGDYENKILKGSEYDSPTNCVPPPRMQRSLPPVPNATSTAEPRYDVPKNQTERKSVDEEKCLDGDIKDVDGDFAENDDLETSQEDLAKLKKEVHDRIKLPIVIENRGESST